LWCCGFFSFSCWSGQTWVSGVCCYCAGGMIWQQNADVVRQKPVVVPLCPPQVPGV
jgi:hypothetical protein